MANATVTPTITDSWDDGKRIHIIGTFAISASPDTYATNGLTVTLPTLSGRGTLVMMELHGGKAGYLYEYDKANNKMLVRQCAAAGNPQAELTGAAAIPAGVSGDTIQFHGIFKKFA